MRHCRSGAGDSHQFGGKTALQEWSQGQGLGLPSYTTEECSRQHGDPERFRCRVSIQGQDLAEAKGRSRKEASRRGNSRSSSPGGQRRTAGIAVTGIPAVPLKPAEAADQLSRPLLVMAHPRHRQDPCGNGNDAETQSITTEASSRPSSVWGTTSP